MARPRNAIGGMARNRYRMRAGCEIRAGMGSRPTTGHQKRTADPRYARCSKAWRPRVWMAASYRLVRWVAQRTTKSNDHVPSGLAAIRTRRLFRTGRRILVRVSGDDARRARVTGAPSTTSGAAIIVSSMCWNMCTDNNALAPASTGPSSARNTTTSPARKHRSRVRGSLAPIRFSRRVASTWTSPIPKSPTTTSRSSRQLVIHASTAGSSSPAPAGFAGGSRLPLSGELVGGGQLGSPGREEDLEHASLAGHAANRDRPAVRLRDGPDDRQAEPEAAGVPASPWIRPGEPVEDPVEVRAGDPGSRIPNGDHRSRGAPSHGHLDRVLGARVVHGVLDEGIERHGQAVRVGLGLNLIEVTQEPSPWRRRPPVVRIQHDPADVDRQPMEEVRILLPGQQEQAVGQPPESLELILDDAGIVRDHRIPGGAFDELGMAERNRDRRAELVGGVLDEPPLPL